MNLDKSHNRKHVHNILVFLQKQAMLVRQLEEELRLRLRQPAPELQQQLEALYAENEHLQREIAILRDTIKVFQTFLI